MDPRRQREFLSRAEDVVDDVSYFLGVLSQSMKCIAGVEAHEAHSTASGALLSY